LSHIPKAIEVSLTSTRGKKALYRVALLEMEDAKFLTNIRNSETLDGLKEVFGRAWKAIRSDVRRATLKQAYDQRFSELSKPPVIPPDDAPDVGADQPPLNPAPTKPPRTFADVAAAINKATTPEAFDLARSMIAEVSDETQRAELNAKATKRYAEIAGGA
jgi:hypothetical protein